MHFKLHPIPIKIRKIHAVWSLQIRKMEARPTLTASPSTPDLYFTKFTIFLHNEINLGTWDSRTFGYLAGLIRHGDWCSATWAADESCTRQRTASNGVTTEANALAKDDTDKYTNLITFSNCHWKTDLVETSLQRVTRYQRSDWKEWYEYRD